jgi:hemolysin III
VTRDLAGPATQRSDPRSRRYGAPERLADAVVHVLGVALALVGCIVLALVALPAGDLLRLGSLALYGAGLLAMLGCSALYHMAGEGPSKAVFRRLDHAAIFVMIAGTYTPFAVVAIGGGWGLGLVAFVWTVAIAGATLKLCCPARFERSSIAVYLLLGWTIMVALEPLQAAVPARGIALIAAGGILYSVGVVFHLWDRLPYHQVVWHVLVLMAAACHYLAILEQVALA